MNSDLFKTEGYSFSVKNDENTTDVWLTPPEIIHEIGLLDLDPCASINQPWPTAKNTYTIKDDGLKQEWRGTVFMNPPYSSIGDWMEKIAYHNNGIALTFARTETQYFHNHVWGIAKSMFFFEGRLCFYRENGIKSKMNAGAPSVLISYGDKCTEILKECNFRGYHVEI